MQRTSQRLLRSIATSAASRSLPSTLHNASVADVSRHAAESRIWRNIATSSRRHEQRPPTLRNDAHAPLRAIPSNIPREDYATPAMYSLGIMAKLFRYSVYASVTIALGGTILYVSMHAYVEYVALHGRNPVKSSDLDGDSPTYEIEELVPGFSGAHLGGGTDPAIGLLARNALRGAWIALNLQRGGVVVGNRSGHTDVEVPDKAWLTAEGYLKHALSQIEEVETTKFIDLSLAKREILLRLAEVHSRLAGPRGLAEAIRLYSLILMDAESASPPSSLVETAELQRKLGEIELRLLKEVLVKRLQPDVLAREQQKALDRLSSSVALALSACQGQHQSTAIDVEPEVDSTLVTVETKKRWWSRSSDSSSRATPQVLNSVDTSSASAVAPKRAARTLLSTLSTLATSLVSAQQTSQALTVVEDALRQVDRFILATSNAAQSEPGSIHLAWLKSRKSLLQGYQAELTHSLRIPNDADAANTHCDEVLQQAIETSKDALAILPTPAKSSAFASPSIYNLPLAEATAAARKAGALAARTKGLLAENRKDYRLALEHYELVLQFVETPTNSRTAASEQVQLRNQAISGIRRTREKLVPSKK